MTTEERRSVAVDLGDLNTLLGMVLKLRALDRRSITTEDIAAYMRINEVAMDATYSEKRG